MMPVSVGVLSAILGDDEGGAPQVRVNVPWQVIATAIVGLLVLGVIAGIVLLIVGRRPGRLPLWRRKRLEIEETMLGEGPGRALVRLRLQLDDAVAVAKSTITTDAADIGDLRLLVMQLESVAGRLARHIDALLASGADSVSRQVVDATRARVREIEAVAASLSDAATAAVTGATAVQIDELSRGVQDQLHLVAGRTDALRELSGDGESNRQPKP